MMDFELRLVQEGDAADLQRNCWPERSERSVRMRVADMLLRQQREVAWGVVAVVDGAAVAYGQVARWLNGGEISDVIVCEALRGNGLGRALVERLVEIAREAGLPEVEVGAGLSKPVALNLYPSAGFRDRRHLVLDLGDGPERVIYLVMTFDNEQSQSACAACTGSHWQQLPASVGGPSPGCSS